MNHPHSHAPTSGHVGVRYRRRMLATFLLVGTFMVVELVFGILSGSLALVSDAGHMLADVVALGAALLATTLAARSSSTRKRTYGSYRAEVFASGFTVLIMLGVAVYVVAEALGRLGDGGEVATTPMLVVGALGLVHQRQGRLFRGDLGRCRQRRGPAGRRADRRHRFDHLGHHRRAGDRRLRRGAGRGARSSGAGHPRTGGTTRRQH